ncbi:(S)-2-hydroxy-acid oxidase [Neofusicoccum parvum]|uniref:(S)-2-hydroxy-acid oxidase n=1 Tax=Neofusicoccum parvum TaxID=310453 RepID=A0ACB5SAT6_9PEZI|nr:(S)-2-hydroxy-acid oxidase [Neofusicoccum parvum]
MAGKPVPTQAGPEPMILSIDDVKQEADKNLSKTARDFYNAGATTQTTVHDNIAAFAKYRLLPRVLVDVSRADPSTTVLGTRISFPCCIAPAGLQAMAHPSGELASSRAAARRGIHMGVSSYANHSIEEIRAAGAAVGPVAHAMQLYSMRDRALQERIVARAEAAGCRAILLTADSPVLGVRWSQTRNHFRTPAELGFPMMEVGDGMERVTKITHERMHGWLSDAHSWAEEIPWLRARTKMEIWVKGVLAPEDVVRAREWGCDGVVVSNHGGRQLDGTPASIDALPACVKAAEGKIRVHVDGGIRSGADVFKALALGAECCWIGRPTVWGLAYNGESGVDKVLNILYDEFKHCMQLTGCSTVADISKASLAIVRAEGPLARL